MNIYNATLLLIGYQNDYFSANGLLRPVIQESVKVNNALKNTVALVETLVAEGPVPPIVATPIVFSEDYRELEHDPVGILQQIKALGALKANHFGSETISELKQFGDRIHYLPGKTGLNAFSSTDLYPFLVGANTQHLVLAGAVTSICIDSTGRSAFELGLNVHVLSDCISARSTLEQEFYCRHIFPIYAQVMTHKDFLQILDSKRE